MEDIVKAIEKISEKSIIDYLLIIVPIAISLVAIFVSIVTARRQNKIAMFELRYKALSTIKRISYFASTFYVTKNPHVVIESFNCCFATCLDNKDELRSLVNARVKMNEMEENVAIISSMLSDYDRKIIEKTFAMLSNIINSAIVDEVNDSDVEAFKVLILMLDKITTQKLSQKILGSSWCFDYVNPYMNGNENDQHVNEKVTEE